MAGRLIAVATNRDMGAHYGPLGTGVEQARGAKKRPRATDNNR